MRQAEVLGVEGQPEIQRGDDLALLIAASACPVSGGQST